MLNNLRWFFWRRKAAKILCLPPVYMHWGFAWKFSSQLRAYFDEGLSPQDAVCKDRQRWRD